MQVHKLAILGAGNLGTTLALMLWEKGYRVELWTIEEDVAESIREGRENPRYLPGHFIHTDIGVTLDIAEALDDGPARNFPREASRQL